METLREKLRDLHWPLVLGLGALALVRPLVRVVGAQLGVDEPPAVLGEILARLRTLG